MQARTYIDDRAEFGNNKFPGPLDIGHQQHTRSLLHPFCRQICSCSRSWLPRWSHWREARENWTKREKALPLRRRFVVFKQDHLEICWSWRSWSFESLGAFAFSWSWIYCFDLSIWGWSIFVCTDKFWMNINFRVRMFSLLAVVDYCWSRLVCSLLEAPFWIVCGHNFSLQSRAAHEYCWG